MKRLKQLLALALILVMLGSIIAIPASATTISWYDKFWYFTNINRNNYHNYTGYVKALQRFLLCYPDTTNIVDDYGLDGQFGNATYAAVVAFQGAKGLEPDGDVGSRTWGAISSSLTIHNFDPNYYFSIAGSPVYYACVISPTAITYKYYLSDTSIGPVFRS